MTIAAPNAEFPVLIVGAGPVGLALAADLSSRGIRSVAVETRAGITTHPRASLLGARSMEYYRRLGLADSILQAGLPTHHQYDVMFVTSLSGRVLHHYSSPSPDEFNAQHRVLATDLPESAWTPYFKVQIGQQALEPIVRDHVLAQGVADLMYGWTFESFEQDEAGVVSVISNVTTGEVRRIRSQYLAACDGGRSTVRSQLGVRYTGRGAMRKNMGFLFESHDFARHATVGRANLYFIFAEGAYGVITNLNGKNLWNYTHYVLDPNDNDKEIDAAAKIRLAMGHDFEFKLLSTMPWFYHQSVAEEFRVGRVFLAGDSAHLFCPTGGIGMNTGIADAFDLGWKLGGVLEGWGGEGLLESYAWERRPVAFRNTSTTAVNADRVDSLMKVMPAEIDEPSDRGEAARTDYARKLKWLSKQFNTMGLQVGHRYDDSSIVISDGTPEPPDDPSVLVQSTWPGGRAPHIWLSAGKSTLDFFDGRHYVLVRSGPDAPSGADFVAAARKRNIPFRCVDISHREACALYANRLVLVRPDGHVCWRNDDLPADPEQILATVTGH